MTLSTLRKKFIGSRAFYAMVMSVVLPIIVQNGITNFVSLLDNIMVGRVGTEPMSGVAIVNQLMFVYNLCVFGGLSGAGIFTAQFFGSRDVEGVRHTFRFKLLLGITLTVIAAAVFLLKGEVGDEEPEEGLYYAEKSGGWGIYPERWQDSWYWVFTRLEHLARDDESAAVHIREAMDALQDEVCASGEFGNRAAEKCWRTALDLLSEFGR